MKKLTFFAAFLMLFQIAFAGGLLTNTNQSAQFVRMMSRNASTGIDAVYFNPAGLIKMEDGWHFAVYNQTILQTKPVDSEFPLLNDGYYKGVVNIPAFPTAFAVYKEDNWAFSLGFGPNGGGGTAEYDRGLPSFEIPITKLSQGFKTISPLLTAYEIPGATGYDASLSFEGTSVFWGLQLGATYQVSDYFSVYGGVRYLPSKNTYLGEIKDIKIKTGDDSNPNYIKADEYLAFSSPVLEGTIGALDGAAAGLNTAIENGLIDPNTPVSNPEILQVLGALGQSGLTNQEAVVFMNQTKGSLEALNNADVSDKYVDTEQTGTGFTPMVGINISPVENLNIALKYEMKTSLILKNNPNENDNYSNVLFGEEVNSSIPAILGVGVGYNTDLIEAQLSYNMYFNKGVNWGPNTRDYAVGHDVVRTREIDKNGFEVGLGLQYNITDEFAFSVGGLYGDMGIADSYQSDFSYSNPSVTAGAGIEWLIADGLTLDAGFSNTFYQDQTVTFNDPHVGTYNETLSKTTMNFAVGLSYSLY
jgi:long-subunit fatty acid transport protein